MSRKRGLKTKDLPPNLYLRKGIYYYRDVRDKKEYSLGKNKSLAITEAIQANIAIFKPQVSLLDRINNVQIVTLHEWLDKYWDILNNRGLSQNSIRDYKTKISIIKNNIKDIDIREITSKVIADFISSYHSQSMAKLIRSALSDAFNEAIAAGIVKDNPVSITKAPKIKVQRSRLTLEQFNIAVANAPELYSNMFLLAILTGQRIGDLAALKWDDIRDNRIYIEQAKTGAKIAIPISLKLDCLNISIAGVLNKFNRSSKTIIGVSLIALRKAFSDSLPKMNNKPTFHEIRSLSARLYEDEKGATFAKNILGHKTMAMTDKYLDDRNHDYNML